VSPLHDSDTFQDIFVILESADHGEYFQQRSHSRTFLQRNTLSCSLLHGRSTLAQQRGVAADTEVETRFLRPVRMLRMAAVLTASSPFSTHPHGNLNETDYIAYLSFVIGKAVIHACQVPCNSRDVGKS
jgi:hypothetical protein